MSQSIASLSDGVSPCTACGACCSYSAEWPRFSIESDEVLDLIPADYINDTQSGMRCEGVRCVALKGEVGRTTHCSIYQVRPEVCRACVPGDDACAMARQAHGLPALPIMEPVEGW